MRRLAGLAASQKVALTEIPRLSFAGYVMVRCHEFIWRVRQWPLFT